jgi:hypothetical protein
MKLLFFCRHWYLLICTLFNDAFPVTSVVQPRVTSHYSLSTLLSNRLSLGSELFSQHVTLMFYVAYFNVQVFEVGDGKVKLFWTDRQ